MNPRWTILLFGAVLANAAAAAPGDKTNLVRELAGRVGPVIGSALACPDIARARIQLIVDKFTAVITEAASSETERSGLTQLLDRNVADGRGAVTSGRIDCRLADRQLADLERSIVRPGPGSSAATALPFSATAATLATVRCSNIWLALTLIPL